MQSLWLIGQKGFDSSVAFGLVTILTGDRQVTGPVGSPAFGDDMIDLQRHIFFPAVHTLTPPFLEQVFSDFVSGEGALLVLYPAELGVLQELGIEPDRFDFDGRNGREPAVAPHPGKDVIDAGH